MDVTFSFYYGHFDQNLKFDITLIIDEINDIFYYMMIC